jgi:hypothetical protein
MRCSVKKTKGRFERVPLAEVVEKFIQNSGAKGLAEKVKIKEEPYTLAEAKRFSNSIDMRSLGGAMHGGRRPN